MHCTGCTVGREWRQFQMKYSKSVLSPCRNERKCCRICVLPSMVFWHFAVLQYYTSYLINMGRKPVLHAWKDYFAHLEKNDNKIHFETEESCYVLFLKLMWLHFLPFIFPFSTSVIISCLLLTILFSPLVPGLASFFPPMFWCHHCLTLICYLYLILLHLF